MTIHKPAAKHVDQARKVEEFRNFHRNDSHMPPTMQIQKICYFQKQHEFNFEKAIDVSKNYSGFVKSQKTAIDWNDLFSLF